MHLSCTGTKSSMQYISKIPPNRFCVYTLTHRDKHSPAVTEGSWTPVPGKVAGEVKLSISYKSNKLFIMVMHIRGLVSFLALVAFPLYIASREEI